MPIVTQGVLDRKKYCPTVYETFGEYPDVVIARCITKDRNKTHITHNVACVQSCAAEFCYTTDPNDPKAVENSFTTLVHLSKTINLELYNDYTNEIVTLKNVEYGDVVRCKFCHNPVGTVLQHRMLDLEGFEHFRPWSDKHDLMPVNGLQPLKMKTILRYEKFRIASIPYMINRYKQEHGIIVDTK